MSVMTAAILRPSFVPIATSACARRRESSSRGRKAPEPVFTSMTMACAPPAIFFDMIEATISGSESTVAVTSRSS
jgi:hypothetical protein